MLSPTMVPRDAPVGITTSLEGEAILVLREGEPAPAPAPPEAESEDLAKSAAEAVTARLSTLFQEPGEEPVHKAGPPEEVSQDEIGQEEPAEATPPADQTPTEAAPHEEPEIRPQPHPERIPENPRPQDDFGMPSFTRLEDPVPFFLRSPEPHDEPPEAEAEAPPAEDEEDATRGRDLFDPTPANDLAEDERAQDSESRQERLLVIDDSAPFEFVPPAVQPLPAPSQGGMLTLVALAVLGLIFFGGGIFWAANARPVAASDWFGPRLVGGLAGIAGVGFFVVAIYFLLDRLGGASERRARQRR